MVLILNCFVFPAESGEAVEEGQGGYDKWMGVDFPVFSVLMTELVKWNNAQAIKNAIYEAEKRRIKLNVAFDKIDADKSGHIDGKELEQLCDTLDLPPSEVHLVMKRLDGDGDGQVSFNEFADAVDPDSVKLAEENAPTSSIPGKRDLKAAFKQADGNFRHRAPSFCVLENALTDSSIFCSGQEWLRGRRRIPGVGQAGHRGQGSRDGRRSGLLREALSAHAVG